MVRLEVHDAGGATIELLAFAALMTLIQRLPGPSANRFGGGGPQAGDSIGATGFSASGP